jgi:hypothetical protein
MIFRASRLSTMGPVGALEELVARSEGLEQAIREIALEVQKLAASQKGAERQRETLSV